MFLRDVYLCRVCLRRGLFGPAEALAALQERRRLHEYGRTLDEVLARQGVLESHHARRLLKGVWPNTPADPEMLEIHLLLASGRLAEPDLVNLLLHPRCEDLAWLRERCLGRADLSDDERDHLTERTRSVLEGFHNVRKMGPNQIDEPFQRLCRLGMEQGVLDSEIVLELLRFRAGGNGAERVAAVLRRHSGLEEEQIEHWATKFFAVRAEHSRADSAEIGADRTVEMEFESEMVESCRRALEAVAEEGGSTSVVLDGTDLGKDGTMPLGASPDPSGASKSGTIERKLGEYEILEEIGRGAMGIVYLARQPDLGRLVALKVLIAGEDASPELIERFKREAQAVGKLRHPNIVTVHDTGVVGHQHYFSMDFIEGMSLAQHLGQDGPLEARRAARIAQQIASALHTAHRSGIVHRDVKPSNILLARDQTAFLSDFGLAADFAASVQLTRTGTAMGTPPYMSPEQVRGNRLSIGARSDVYSLGATLYHFLAGQAPFQGEDALEIIQKVLKVEPPALRRFNPSLPRDLETIVLRCMEKNPARRYRSAFALQEDLNRFLAGEPIAARPPGHFEKAVRWMSRNRSSAVAIFLGIAFLAVLAGLGVERYLRNVQLTDHLQEAREAAAGGGYGEAIDSYREVLLLDPGNGPATQGLKSASAKLFALVKGKFEVAYQEGQFKVAEASLRENEAWLGGMSEYRDLRDRLITSLSIRPYQELVTGLNRALVEINNGRPQSALHPLDELGQRYGDLLSVRLLQAMTRLLASRDPAGIHRKAHLQAALSNLEDLAVSLPRHWGIALLRSLCLFEVGSMEDALSEMERAFVLLQWQAEFEANLRFENRLMRIADGDPDRFLMFVLRERLLVMLNLRRCDPAWGQTAGRSISSDLASLQPLLEGLSVRFFLAIKEPLQERFAVYRDRDRILADLASGRIAPADLRVALRIGVRYLALTGRDAEARKILDGARVFLGASGEAEQLLAADLDRLAGRHREALARLEGVQEGDAVRLVRAWTLIRMGDGSRRDREDSSRRVLALLDSISSDSPLFGRTCLLRGIARFHLGQWDRSIEMLERAARFLEGWPEPHLYRGFSLRAAGREEEANEAWGIVRALHPGYDDVIRFRRSREIVIRIGSREVSVPVRTSPEDQFELAEDRSDLVERVAYLLPVLYFYADFESESTWFAVVRLADLSLRLEDEENFQLYRNILHTRLESGTPLGDYGALLDRFLRRWSEEAFIGRGERFAALTAYWVGIKREFKDRKPEEARTMYQQAASDEIRQDFPFVQEWARDALLRLGKKKLPQLAPRPR